MRLPPPLLYYSLCGEAEQPGRCLPRVTRPSEVRELLPPLIFPLVIKRGSAALPPALPQHRQELPHAAQACQRHEGGPHGVLHASRAWALANRDLRDL